MCEDSIEFPYTPPPVSTIISIFHLYGRFATITELPLIHY